MNIQDLPSEMIVEILKHLDTPKRTTFDQKLHLVCKSFFYPCRFLELSKLNQGMPTFIKAANHPLAREIKSGQKEIKKLEIHSQIDVDEIGKFLTKNIKIEDLKITTRVSDNFEINYLLQKLKHLPLLEDVAIQFHSHNPLINEFNDILKDKIIVKIIDSCPNLRSFSLHLPYSGAISSQTFEAFSKLRNLKILKLKNVTLLPFNGIFRNLFPQLEKISMPNQFHPLVINTFFDNAPKITSCTIASGEVGMNGIDENTINNLNELQMYASFREIVDEGLFNLKKMHFFYGELLGDYCDRFQDFENLTSVIIEPFEDDVENIREIKDFEFVNDVTLNLFNFNNLNEEDLGTILSNDKIKHLVISDGLIHYNENPYLIQNHSLKSISLKGIDLCIIHNIQVLHNHNLTKLIKKITLKNEPKQSLIFDILKCRNLEELKINNGEFVLKGKMEILSYLVDLAKLKEENLDKIYPFLIEAMSVHKHPLSDLLDFITEHKIEDQIFELNLNREIDGFEDRFLKLPNLERLSFFDDFDVFEGRQEILDFLTRRLPLNNNMLGKRSSLENLETNESKRKK